jgi:hypothetical protein
MKKLTFVCDNPGCKQEFKTSKYGIYERKLDPHDSTNVYTTAKCPKCGTWVEGNTYTMVDLLTEILC